MEIWYSFIDRRHKHIVLDFYLTLINKYENNRMLTFAFYTNKMIKLNYKIIGEGQPVIILHGLFGMMDNWQSFGKGLAKHEYKIFLPDLRDHGRSPFTQTFNYHVLAEDLRHFMDDQFIEQAIFIGHSMGGKAAMRLALDHAGRVTKLVVVDIASKAYNGGHEPIFQALSGIEVNKADDRNEVYTYLKNKLGEEEATIQFLMKNLSRKIEGGFEWKMNYRLLQKNYEHILEAITSTHSTDVPTLFVRGGMSHYVENSDWEAIAKLFSNVRLSTIADAGHWIHAEKGEELLQVVLDFLLQE